MFFFVWLRKKYNMSKIEIKGNHNQVYNKVKGSRINSDDINGKPKKNWAVWITIGIAVLTLIVTCIIGRNEIISFFR